MTTKPNDPPFLPYKQDEMPEFVSINKAAKIIGIKYRQLLEAVKEGHVQHYKLRNSRMLVSIPEIIAQMRVEGGRK